MSESANHIFRKFATKAEAEELMQLLHEHNIQSSLAKDSNDLEGTIAGTVISNTFEVRLFENDFESAENLLAKITEENLGEVEPDYYLLQFSDSELKEILVNSYEWSEYDVALSKKLLKERNISFDIDEINILKEEKLKKLSLPENGQIAWIVFGYVSAFVGGFLGLLIGYFLWKTKKNLPNGKKVFVYNDSIRNHGLRIFVISVVLFPIFFLVKFFDKISYFTH
jgi:hypothetical protein